MIFPASLKIACAVLIIMLIGAGFWLTDWQKKSAEIRQLQALEKTKTAELDNNRAAARALPGETEKKKSLERELRAVVQQELSAESRETFIPSYISDVERLVALERSHMEDPDFQISSLSPGALKEPEATKGDTRDEGRRAAALCPTCVFKMQFSGRYLTLIDFLRELGALKLKRLVTISRISLSPSGAAGGIGSPVLDIQMPVMAYLRQGEACR
jgi:Tfp pilus assembly protein PilO